MATAFDDLNSAQSKRKRVSRACDVCFKRKDKCDGVRPICTLCEAHSLPCTWNRPSQKRGPPAGQRLLLETKLRNLEAFLGYLCLIAPALPLEIESNLALGSGNVEAQFQKWSDESKRSVWNQTKLAKWLSERECADDKQILLPRSSSEVERLHKPSLPPLSSMMAFPEIHDDVNNTYTNPSSSAQTSPSLMTPSNFAYGERASMPDADTIHYQESEHALRSSITNAIKNPHVASILAASPNTTDNAAQSFGRTEDKSIYAPAGDVFKQARSEHYAGPPSGLYMLRSRQSNDDQASTSPPLKRTRQNKEGEMIEEPWVHSHLPSPATSDGEDEADFEGTPGISPHSHKDLALLAAAASSVTSSLFPNEIQDLDTLLDIYFTNAHPFFPFVDKAQILRWGSRSAAYDQRALPSPSESDTMHPALILSLCSVACTYASQPSDVQVSPTNSTPSSSIKKFAKLRVQYLLKSRDHLLPRLGEEMNLSVVQSFLLMAISDLASGKDSRSWIWLGMAIRAAQNMGLHRANMGGNGDGSSHRNNSNAPEPGNFRNDGETERRRLTWWSCFCFDTLLSLYLGRPTAIHRSGFECQIPLADGPDEWELCRMPVMEKILDYKDTDWKSSLACNGRQVKSVRVRVLSIFAAFAELCDILHDIHSLYALPPLVHTPKAVTIVLQLTVRLHRWRSLLPDHLSAILDHTKSNKEGSPAPYMPIFSFSALYHVGIILLYRPFLDVGVDHPLQADALKQCLTSSNCLVDIFSSYCFVFGQAKAPPFAAYGLLTSTTIQLWCWTKSDVETSNEAVQNLNQLLNLFRCMAPYSSAIAKRFHIVQKTLSRRPSSSNLRPNTINTNTTNKNYTNTSVSCNTNPLKRFDTSNQHFGQRTILAKDQQQITPTSATEPLDDLWNVNFMNDTTANSSGDVYLFSNFYDFDFSTNLTNYGSLDSLMEPSGGMISRNVK